MFRSNIFSSFCLIDCFLGCTWQTFPLFSLLDSWVMQDFSFFRGGFFVTNSTPKNFLGGFKAQLPPSISRRASEFSGKMPLVLSVELLPQSQILSDHFQNYSPDLCDTALYCSPDDNIERFVLATDFCVAISASAFKGIFWLCSFLCLLLTYSSKEHAASLFEQMEVQNSMMRSSFNGVELLIFTSKQLQVDSQSELSFFHIIQFSYFFSL